MMFSYVKSYAKRKDVSACARLFLVFLFVSLELFEWQSVAAAVLGEDQAGVFLGTANSTGVLLATIVILFLVARRMPIPGQTLVMSTLLFLSILSWVTANQWASKSMLSSVVVAVYAGQAGLGILAFANETSAIQLLNPTSWARVRVFGSLGYLVAAVLSQYLPGRLFFPAMFIPAVYFALPNISKTARDSGPDYARVGVLAPTLIPIGFGYFLLAVASRGFDQFGPIHLRDKSEFGLTWLVILIAAESIFLTCVSPKIANQRLVVCGSALAWSLVYLMLLQASGPSLFFAMVLGGLNCPAQVALQTIAASRFGPSPSINAILQTTGAAAAFVTSIGFSLIATPNTNNFAVSLGLSLAVFPILIVCQYGLPGKKLPLKCDAVIKR